MELHNLDAYNLGASAQGFFFNSKGAITRYGRYWITIVSGLAKVLDLGKVVRNTHTLSCH